MSVCYEIAHGDVGLCLCVGCRLEHGELMGEDTRDDPLLWRAISRSEGVPDKLCVSPCARRLQFVQGKELRVS